jgi:two-component system, OmpR family, phosphate regulon response regulator PhoB
VGAEGRRHLAIVTATDRIRWARPRVLLVDDDDLLRMVVARQLRQGGFDVIEARDGLEALARTPAAAPDLILTDLNMPRCSGEDLCAALRREPATASLPIVVMTGGPIDETRLREVGCASVLSKPLPRMLPAILRNILWPSPMDTPAA